MFWNIKRVKTVKTNKWKCCSNASRTSLSFLPSFQVVPLNRPTSLKALLKTLHVGTSFEPNLLSKTVLVSFPKGIRSQVLDVCSGVYGVSHMLYHKALDFGRRCLWSRFWEVSQKESEAYHSSSIGTCSSSLLAYLPSLFTVTQSFEFKVTCVHSLLLGLLLFTHTFIDLPPRIWSHIIYLHILAHCHWYSKSFPGMLQSAEQFLNPKLANVQNLGRNNSSFISNVHWIDYYCDWNLFLHYSSLTALGISMLLSFLFNSLVIVWRSG